MITQRGKDTGVHAGQWTTQEVSQTFSTPITISVPISYWKRCT